FRAVLNQSARSGLTFEVVDPEKLDGPGTAGLLGELRAVSNAWLSQKAVAEKRFSLGFFNDEYLRSCPIAVVRKGPAPAEGSAPTVAGKVVAFANILATEGKQELSVDL